MQVKDLMSKSVLSCRADESLERAAQQMWEGEVGALPVIDSQGSVVGVITDRDICMAAYTQGCGLAARTIGTVMTQDVETCAPSDSLTVAEEHMRRRQVRRLPIVDDGKLAGMLSLNDLALATTRKNTKARQLNPQELATTLAGICEHRPHGAIAAE